MIHQTHQFFEDYVAARYHFEHAGDKLPMHSHTPETQHDCSVLEGSVRVNTHIVLPGETYKFDSSQPHEIVALEPNTVTYHVYDTFPAYLLSLPKACLEATIGPDQP